MACDVVDQVAVRFDFESRVFVPPQLLRSAFALQHSHRRYGAKASINRDSAHVTGLMVGTNYVVFHRFATSLLR